MGLSVVPSASIAVFLSVVRCGVTARLPWAVGLLVCVVQAMLCVGRRIMLVAISLFRVMVSVMVNLLRLVTKVWALLTGLMTK